MVVAVVMVVVVVKREERVDKGCLVSVSFQLV